MTDVRVLSADDVRRVLDVPDVVDAVRDGYRQRGDGAPARPRTHIRRDDPAGIVTGYSAILPDTGVAGGYMYTAGYRDGDAWFVLPVFDADTGEPVAILDGSSMNPVKTGAAGAVAADALARGDASQAAIVGSGRQAWGQLRCLATVRDLDRVRVFSPTADHREAFADAAEAEIGVAAEASPSAAKAIADADVVVTATTATTPVFDDADLPDGAHVTAMGQYHPKRREIPVDTVARSTYVLDLLARIDQDAGAFIAARKAGRMSEDDVHGELGDVLTGSAAGRTAHDEVTLFDSGGTAIETLACASVVIERARDEGLGRVVEWTGGEAAMPRPWS